MLWFNDPSEIAKPFSDHLYKVVLLVDTLNPVLAEYVASPDGSLEDLSCYSKHGRLFFKGIYQIRKSSPVYKIGIKRIGFHAEFSVGKVQDNNVTLQVRDMRLVNHKSETNSLDLIRHMSRFLPGLRKRVIRIMTERIPEIMKPQNDFSEVIFHSDHFIKKVSPTLLGSLGSLGEIKIINVQPVKDNRVIFYVHSNLILINLVNALGPEYLTLEEIQAADESQEMLWEIFKRDFQD